MIKQFNKTNLNEMRNDINEALEAVSKKHGVQINLGNISYSDAQFTTKLTATVGETAADAGKVEWDKWCFRYGLKKEDFGKTFTSNGTSFTVSGIKPKSTKYPVLATNATGTTYKFPASIVAGFNPKVVTPIMGGK